MDTSVNVLIDHSSRSTSSNFVTSTTPRSVILSEGTTGKAVNARAMNGSPKGELTASCMIFILLATSSAFKDMLINPASSNGKEIL